MYGVSRMKRVTDPLADKVKARIVGRDRIEPGYVSSGSEHSRHADDDVTSPSFSELFFGFGGGDDGEASAEGQDSDSECDPFRSESNFKNAYLIKPVLLDEFGNVLRAHVLRAVEMLSAGNYEFVDVLTKDSSTRYFIDLDFAAEFEIARPTSSYERLLQNLPRIFVGKSEDLKQILKPMSDAARRSLKSRDLHLPPWRKHRFMQNKWLGPYRRTTNLFPPSFSSQPQLNRSSAVECRAVGFEAGAAVEARRLLISATARTR